MKPRTLIAGTILLAIVAGLFIWAFRPQPVPVDLATVKRGHMQVTINADGKTRIREIYEVAAPISGQAQRSVVSVGDRVVAGETVVAEVRPIAPSLLDARTRMQAEAAVEEAEAALEVAKSQLVQAAEEFTYAQSQYDRISSLVSRGVAPLTQLEDVEQRLRIKAAALDTARAQRAMAESALARARASLVEPTINGTEEEDACCIAIYAPADGVVLEIANVSERPVVAGEMLLKIGDPTDLEIVADLLSSDAIRISVGALAHVERWGGPVPLTARLRKIEPSARTKVSALGIEEQRVDVIFDLINPPEERPMLGDGFSVYLRIVEWEADDVLQVPMSAIFRSGEEWHVFREENGRAREVPVTLGRRNGRTAQVLEGLTEGDRVVTHPSERVSDGVVLVNRASL